MIRRRPPTLRGVVVGLLVFAGVVLLARWSETPSGIGALDVVLGVPHHVERTSFDMRMAARPPRPPGIPIVIAYKPASGGGGRPLREDLARAISALRRARVAAVGIDILLVEHRAGSDEVDAMLSRALAGEEVVLAAEMVEDAGRSMSQTAAGSPASTRLVAAAYREALEPFRRAAPISGFINLQRGTEDVGVVRSVEIHRERPGFGRHEPSFALAIALVVRVRHALDRRSLPAALEARLRDAIARGQAAAGGDDASVSEALAALVRAAAPAPSRGPGEDAAAGPPLPGPLLARVEAILLLGRLGLSPARARTVSGRLTDILVSDFLGAGLPPAAAWRDAGGPPTLTIDFPGRPAPDAAPYPLVSLGALAADDGSLGHLLQDRAVRASTPRVRIRPPATGGGTVTGRVVDARGGPVAGVEVFLVGLDGPQVARGITLADGRFTVGGLAPGRYAHVALYRLAQGAIRLEGPGPAVGEGPASVTIVLPSHDATVRLGPHGGQVAGARTPERESPLVRLHGLDTWPSTISDAAGRFTLPLPEGSFEVKARHQGRQVTWPGPQRDALRLSVSVEPPWISGRLVARDGSMADQPPVPGAFVELVPAGTSYEVTLMGGSMSEHLPAGDYEVLAYAPPDAQAPIVAGADAPPPGPRIVQFLGPGPHEVPVPAPARVDAGMLGSLPPPAEVDETLAGGRVEAVSLSTGQKAVGTVRPGGRVEFAGPKGYGPWMLLAALPGQPAGSAIPGLDLLEGAIVLVGSRLPEEHDEFPTPLDFGRGTQMYGVEIHGAAIENLLTGRGIVDGRFGKAGGAPLLGQLCMAGGTLVLSSVGMAVLEMSLALSLWTIMGLSYTAFAFRLLWSRSLWIDLPVVLLGLLLILGYWFRYHYRMTWREAKKRKDIFSRFVDPTMVARILEAEKLELFGERVRITVLFSDIRGFTTMSEGTDPHSVLAMLNDYFSEMVPILKRNGGTLDKYIGDAIMGFFGAPVPSRRHALEAVTAAVEMLEANRRLKAQRVGWFDIGFGVNTGEAVTGLVGARDGALNYSVIGDTVNLASRLESLNKEHHSEILISESTYVEVKDQFETVPIGEVSVKGKLEKVKVFQVLSKRAPVAPAAGPTGGPAR